MIFRGYQSLGGEHERIKWTPKHSSRAETRNMTVSRVSWRTVVYFAIVACATVLYFLSLFLYLPLKRDRIFRKQREEKARAPRIMQEHSVGQVFHTTGRDLYKSVYLTSDIMSQPR